MALAELPKILAVFREALQVPADIPDENLILFSLDELGLRGAKTARLLFKFLEAGIVLDSLYLEARWTVREFLEDVYQRQVNRR